VAAGEMGGVGQSAHPRIHARRGRSANWRDHDIQGTHVLPRSDNVREAAHGDLLLALAVACWVSEHSASATTVAA